MKRALLTIPLILAGCSTPIPLLGISLDGKYDVPVEAKVINNGGQVLPVPNTHFSYKVVDTKYTAVTADLASPSQTGSFTTDFDGKATIRVPDGLLLISGFYTLNSGQSKIVWDKAEFWLPTSKNAVRLTNDNGSVTNH